MRYLRTAAGTAFLCFAAGCFIWPTASAPRTPTASGSWVGVVVHAVLYDHAGKPHEVSALHILTGPRMTSPDIPNYRPPEGLDPILLHEDKRPWSDLPLHQKVSVTGSMSAGTVAILPDVGYLALNRVDHASSTNIYGIITEHPPQPVGEH